MKKIIYPGTFDPFHNGHEKIVRTLSDIFDKVIVIVFDNSNKNTTLNKDIRSKAIGNIFKSIDNIEVITSERSLIEELEFHNVKYLARGVRNSEDVVIEMQRSNMMSKIGEVKTIFIPSEEETAFLSSSIIRELIILGKDFSMFVNKEVYNIYKK